MLKIKARQTLNFPALLLWTLAFLTVHTRIFAQTHAGYTIDPSHQEVVISAEDEANEAQETTAKLVVENTTTTAATFEVFAIEFSDTAHFGSFRNTDFSNIAARQELLAVHFDADRFVVDSGSKHTITMTIQNRADLRPGGTYASIIVRQIIQPQAGQQPVVPALASQLLIRKRGGEIHNISLTQVDGAAKNILSTVPKSLQLTFTNNGNVHLIPRGTIEVTDVFGRVVAQGLVNDSSFYVLPSTKRVIPVVLAKSLALIPLVPHFLTIKGSAETIGYTYEKSFIIIQPWLIEVGILLVCAGFLKWYFKRRSKLRLAKELPRVKEL